MSGWMTRRMQGVHRAVLAGLLLGFTAVAQAATHTVAVETDLRAAPALNAKTLQHLQKGALLDAVEQQGGWLKAQAGDQTGWVRLAHLRTVDQGKQGAGKSGGGLGFLGALFTAASNSPTATTGTRGLSEEELAQAQPAPAEVQGLDRYAVTSAQARSFAQQGHLQARDFDYTSGAKP
ncbi:MAG: SH3 domain-containing protein [Castellaniella sp.]